MIWIIFAHYIGDWAYQNDFVAQNKGKYWIIMLSHCIVWTACVSIALQYLGIFTLEKALFLFIGHWICDKLKCNRIRKDCQQNPISEKWNLFLLYTDQSWHLIQCIIVYLF